MEREYMVCQILHFGRFSIEQIGVGKMEILEIIERLKQGQKEPDLFLYSDLVGDALDEAIKFIERYQHGFLCPRCRLLISDDCPTISPLV